MSERREGFQNGGANTVRQSEYLHLEPPVVHSSFVWADDRGNFERNSSTRSSLVRTSPFPVYL